MSNFMVLLLLMTSMEAVENEPGKGKVGLCHVQCSKNRDTFFKFMVDVTLTAT